MKSITKTSYELLNISYNGFLYMKSFLGFWHLHWFILHHNKLEFYQQNDPHNKKNKCLGEFTLNEFTIIEESDKMLGRSNCFSIITKGNTLHFSTDEKHERDSWVEAFNRLV